MCTSVPQIQCGSTLNHTSLIPHFSGLGNILRDAKTRAFARFFVRALHTLDDGNPISRKSIPVASIFLIVIIPLKQRMPELLINIMVQKLHATYSK